MAPKPEPPEEAPDESWMATFADMVTLLMAFFVMLLNFSKIDIQSLRPLLLVLPMKLVWVKIQQNILLK